MDFLELVKRRQSDRRYSDEPVSDEQLLSCLEAARLAPSACNSQPWRFVVVTDPELLRQVGSAAASLGMNGFAKKVPVIVAVVLEKMNLEASIGSVIKDKEYSLLDLGIAAEHFCLQAASLGLGTCMLGWFDEKRVRKLLDVGRRRIPLLITLGHPEGNTRDKSRKKLNDIVRWNHY